MQTVKLSDLRICAEISYSVIRWIYNYDIRRVKWKWIDDSNWCIFSGSKQTIERIRCFVDGWKAKEKQV